MSVCLIIVPVISGAWPLLAGIASVSAARLGYQVMNRNNAASTVLLEQTSGVEVSVTEDEVLAEGLRPEESLDLVKDDFTVRVARDARGRLSIHVDSMTRSHKEIEAEAQKVVLALRRQFAYVKTVQALKRKGYSVAEETVDESGNIRIRLTRYPGAGA